MSLSERLVASGKLPTGEALSECYFIANLAIRQADQMRETLEKLAAQSSGIVGSTARADCMAALASACLASLPA